MAAPPATQKRVEDMTPAERLAAREAVGVDLDHFAEHCMVERRTVRNWEFGVETRVRLAFRCYVEELQRLLDEAGAGAADAALDQEVL